MQNEKIKYQTVKVSSERIHSIANNMKSLLDNIAKNTGNINNSWEGNASDYYVGKMTQLVDNFEEIYVELENSVLYLANVTEGYQAMDEKIVQEICNNLNITEPSLGTSSIFN